MPFKSEKQRRFLHAKHPEIAKRWEHEGETKKGESFKKAAARRRKRRK